MFGVSTYGHTTFAGPTEYIVAIALTGQSLTAAQGSVSPANSEALSGQSLTAARGTLTFDTAVMLAGQAGAVAQSSVTRASSISLSGQATVAAYGSVIPTAALALTGLPLVVGRGSVIAEADATAALTGQSATAALGSITGSVTATELPTPPYVPPTIAYGFRAQRPAHVGWAAGGSSGAAWNTEPDTPNEWTNGAGQTGANWKKS